MAGYVGKAQLGDLGMLQITGEPAVRGSLKLPSKLKRPTIKIFGIAKRNSNIRSIWTVELKEDTKTNLWKKSYIKLVFYIIYLITTKLLN